jgi:hypothetical protein
MSRKSMRVATIFTGVAACVAPMAQAAHAQVTRPDAKLGPENTRIAACGGRSTWVHMGYLTGGTGNYTAYSSCAGFVGGAGFTVRLRGFCGGNNQGHLFGYTATANLNWHYGHGNYYALWAPSKSWGTTSDISLSRYSGTLTCPNFRTVYHSIYGI